MDGEMFYTNRNTRGTASTQQVERAQRICFQCPVIDACAKYADDNQEAWGVWGGVDRSPKNFKDKRWRELAMARRMA
jgi:WhiB family redox-sensing transcriptional regulator